MDSADSASHDTHSLISSLRSASGIFVKRTDSETSFEDKYGKLDKHSLGKGANGVVRLAHKRHVLNNGVNSERLYAVKQFRKRNDSESKREYIKKVTAEFCISSSLHHQNIIETVDLIQNHRHQWCEVMEFCPGGDLCSLIQHSKITREVANCFFAQLLAGVSYIHTLGVAHRDLKPENLMLNAHGFLKITDFGEAEVFKTPYESLPHKSSKIVGSEPYQAPEEFTATEFDPQLVDLWACGIIYVAMIHSRIPWMKPVVEDVHYQFYLNTYHTTPLSTTGCISSSPTTPTFELIDTLSPLSRDVIRHILDPNPETRITVRDVLETAWYEAISTSAKTCMEEGRGERDFYNGALDVSSPTSSTPNISGNSHGSEACRPSLTPGEKHHLRHHPLNT